MNERIKSGDLLYSDSELKKEPIFRIGVVTDCDRLNILECPKPDAEIICKITALSELMIDDSKSSGEWLSVCTEAGLEGFCLRKFVAVRQ